MSFSERLSTVRERMQHACEKSGRALDQVTLVAVSKTHDADRIREAYAAGQRHFGENYAQEFAKKAAELRDLDGIVWHFIGNIQGNKAKMVAEFAHVVHTIDRLSIACELAKRRAAFGLPPLDVLLEVNASGEEQKHGCNEGDLHTLATAVRALPALHLRGLMTVAAQGDEGARAAFSKLASLAKSEGVDDLSMGMSHDLEIAIAEGATIVRVGTALFGERSYPR